MAEEDGDRMYKLGFQKPVDEEEQTTAEGFVPMPIDTEMKSLDAPLIREKGTGKGRGLG